MKTVFFNTYPEIKAFGSLALNRRLLHNGNGD